jgi:membrane protease YdiL (CAAX protease family)
MFTDSEGRLRPASAFVLSAALSCMAFVVTGYVAAALAGDHILRFEAIFRPVLAAELLAAFSWLLTAGNHVESHRIAAQGLPLTPGWARHFGIGCAIGAGLVIVSVIPIAILGHLTFRTTLSLRSFERMVLVVFVVLAGALAEELMFRGYPFQRLVEATGAARAIVVFSILFGAVHLMNPGSTLWGLVNTIAIGIFLAIAYLRSRALWLPWGFHFAWNLTMGLLIGLPVSGFRLFNIVVHGTATGPKWLTGGSYGIEASAAGALAIAIGLLIVWLLPLRPLLPPSRNLPGPSSLQPEVPDSSHLPSA